MNNIRTAAASHDATAVFLLVLLLVWSQIGRKYGYSPSESAVFTGLYQSMLFIVGNSSTSLIAGEFVSSITSLSMP